MNDDAAKTLDDAPEAPRRAPRHVVITGFMAAGKTTVARALAALTGRAMVDTDDLIHARTGRTPQQIIDEDGEPRFRELETRALADALSRTDPCVVATGGGAWTLDANRELVARAGCLSVWLDAPFKLCWQRILGGDAARPLARSREAARRLYESRRGLYALAAARVEVREGASAAALAAEIEKLLRPSQDGRRTGETVNEGGNEDG